MAELTTVIKHTKSIMENLHEYGTTSTATSV